MCLATKAGTSLIITRCVSGNSGDVDTDGRSVPKGAFDYMKYNHEEHKIFRRGVSPKSDKNPNCRGLFFGIPRFIRGFVHA
jgi:hypothetical protein